MAFTMMRQGKWLLIGAVSVLILSFFLYRHLSEPSYVTEENLKPHEALGTVLAEETSRLIGGKGQVVIICFDPKKGFPGQRDAGADIFRKVAGKHGLNIVATENIVYGPEILHGKPAISPERLQQLAGQYGNVDAIISFIGGPVLTLAEVAQLPQQRPRLVCIATDPAVATGFDMVIVPQQGAIPSDPLPTSLRGWFNRYYRILQ